MSPLKLFAILQKYDFSSKSQPNATLSSLSFGCLRYCKSTIFQANHNNMAVDALIRAVVCDTAKVRFFKQITTYQLGKFLDRQLFAILQKYDFSSKSQRQPVEFTLHTVVCDTAKVRFFKQITTNKDNSPVLLGLFAILQKYDFSSKSQLQRSPDNVETVVCDTAKVRFFKQITTQYSSNIAFTTLFAILQKYDFSSKSQLIAIARYTRCGCLRYCKSTIFQANHNSNN